MTKHNYYVSGFQSIVKSFKISVITNMANLEIPAFIQNLLDRVAVEQGFKDYDIQYKNGSRAGDGFMSEIISVTITERNSGNNLQIVCKLAPQNKNRRKEFISDLAFGREVFFYRSAAPTFEKYQIEKNLPKADQFVAYPKCYSAIADDATEEYVLILEDLRPQGYQMWNKSIAAPIQNVRLAMREIGKFHGISFAMKHQRPEEFELFKQKGDICREFLKSQNMLGVMEATYDRAIGLLKSEEHKSIYRHIKENIVAYFEHDVGDKAAQRFGVLSHGDFWINNLLFKSSDDNITENIRLLDWQLLRYASPAIDLLYNLFTSTDKTLRDKEYNDLLQTYYQSLSHTISLLGSDPNELFTFEDLTNELKMYGNHALFMAPTLLEISLADSSDLTNLNEMCDDMAVADGTDTHTQHAFVQGLDDEAQSRYGQRLNDVVEDIIRLGYYHKLDINH